MPVKESFTLPADRLRALADRYGSSPPAVARAAVLLVLSRFAGPDDPLKGAAPTFGELIVRAGAADVPFTLTEVDGRAEVVTDLVDATTAARLAEHCAVALEQVERDPALGVGDVALLSAEERERVLHEFNDTAAPFASDAGVHELFQAQVERTPHAVAVVGGDQTLTYGGLNARANRLARTLRGAGVRRGGLVGVCLERSPELVVAMLAVLKAGAAYVPLDPDYPAERVEFMIRDTGLPLVVTSPACQDRTPGVAQVLVDGSPSTSADTDPPPAVGPDDLAYVMYTSGSTGRPKGVMVGHRAICRLVNGNRFAEVTAADVVALAASFSFDAFTFECWAALTTGARLVVLSGETVLDARKLKTAVHQHGITTMYLAAWLFNQHALESPDLFAGMRTVLYGGEAVDRSAADGLVAGPWAPDAVVNGYGPTEATTFTACHRIRPGDGRPVMPIGRPIANTEAFVMDRWGAPVPVGVPGELWVGGPGVAHGYWNRPGLTAERFTAHPFTPGARVYRSGDLVRWLPTGELEFLGRMDRQVKIRGFRIEPLEIEAVLTARDGVTAAVVEVREESAGDKRLVAYCVSTETVEALRECCRRSLPDYMVPSAFVLVDSFALTPNGKLDRAALPAPDVASRYVAPRTRAEETIVKIWAEVLNVPRVGVHDDFFELGGQSLLATRIMSRIRRQLGVEVRMRMLLDAPTVAGLAERIGMGEFPGAAEPAAPPLVRRGPR
ncbi:non-ribosomal peptide synthetase [Actinomadura litoris]|uniref:non-ribosomal peptide synthetase n=1 Tax=Actinomadura litoris TaxID=2678616 RepID=UPI001FA73CFB|nr:non-ribosomal peptide synthetase [Actinomadura litoris]